MLLTSSEVNNAPTIMSLPSIGSVFIWTSYEANKPPTQVGPPNLGLKLFFTKFLLAPRWGTGTCTLLIVNLFENPFSPGQPIPVDQDG